MWTTPIVNGRRPPSHRLFSAIFTRKGQRFTNLGGTHQAGCTVATLQGGRIGHLTAQPLQSLANPLLATIVAPSRRLP